MGSQAHLCMKEGCLFACFVLFVAMKSTTQGGMLQIAFLVSLESSRQGGVHQLSIHGVWTCDAKVVDTKNQVLEGKIS